MADSTPGQSHPRPDIPCFSYLPIVLHARINVKQGASEQRKVAAKLLIVTSIILVVRRMERGTLPRRSKSRAGSRRQTRGRWSSAEHTSVMLWLESQPQGA
ncbi:MAG: hypothetical protein NXI04_16215 [Planctomycetaceae bacterium]|nr:hypothetical protein [Planctomycetaceae bacterium]